MATIETLRRVYHGRLVAVEDTARLRETLQRLWDATDAWPSYEERMHAYELSLIEEGLIRDRVSTTMAEPCDLCGKLDADQCKRCNKEKT